MSGYHTQRLEKRILVLLADLYFKELKDPDIGFVTFTRCELSKDYSYAKVFVSIFGSEDEQMRTFEALKRCSPFIRGRIAKNIRTKKIPVVHFKLDKSIEKAARIEALLDSESR